MHKYVARVDIVLIQDSGETLLGRVSFASEDLRDAERAYARAHVMLNDAQRREPQGK